MQAHVQQGGIEGLRMNQGQGTVNRSGRSKRRALAFQNIFDEHLDQHFILDHEDMTTRKQLIGHARFATRRRCRADQSDSLGGSAVFDQNQECAVEVRRALKLAAPYPRRLA